MGDTAERQELQLSDFQNRVLVIPEEYDIFMGGGRGGSKSYTFALLALRHAELYQERARILYIRRSYKSLADFELLTRELFGQVYGQAARYNATEHVWRLPGGAYFELGQLEGPHDYSKYQGRSFTLLLIDEAGEWASPADLDRLRSNLRGPKDMPIRTVMAANPGGAGHAWLAKRYVFKDAAPWEPFSEEVSGRTWISAPSTYKDNPFIDHAQYREQLRASCPTDPELLRAWLEGDWTVARGAFFAGVLEESRVAVDPWESLPDSRARVSRDDRTPPGHGCGGGKTVYTQLLESWKSDWQYYLAHDYGSAAPSVTYLIAKSPGAEHEGRFWPRGSLILVDELATSDPDDPSKGLQWPVPMQADAIREMCEAWGARPEGVADDAIFSNHGSGAGTIADEFNRAGVRFQRAGKGDRLGGWETMKRLLQGAGQPDVPGLYVSRRCSYWWQTVPYLGRDKRRVEDVDTAGIDHAADATRYGCVWQRPGMETVRVRGLR